MSSSMARPSARSLRTPRLSDILSQRPGAEIDAFEPAWLPFDHPLWIVYSSGTTGLPKPIVHGHGGVIIVALPLNVLHNDIGCSYHAESFGERYHWYSSTGWIMWNCQVGGLLGGTTICIFDGSPGGIEGQAGLDRRCGASSRRRRRPSSAPARRSSPTA